MFCTNCGAGNEEGIKFCTNCGAPLTPQENSNQSPVQSDFSPNQQPYTAPVQPGYDPNMMAYAASVQPKEKLGWAKFLGYFALWLGAVINLASGISAMTGGQYEGQADLVYSVFSSLKGIDTIYGLLCIVVAVIDVIAAVCIIKRKKLAIIMVPVIYGLSSIMVLGYSIVVSGIIGNSSVVTSSILNIAVSAVMCVVNFIYFNNRKNIFCK